MDWRPHRRPASSRVHSRHACAPAILALIGAASSPLVPSAQAGIITDKSFFNSLPTTTINFETNGSGGAISLLDGQTLTMPTSAYASQGVVFQNQISWVNDGGVDFDVAQFLGGSPDIGIPASGVSTFTINFTVPVRSVGLFVVNTHIVDSTGPMFVAKDSQGVGSPGTELEFAL